MKTTSALRLLVLLSLLILSECRKDEKTDTTDYCSWLKVCRQDPCISPEVCAEGSSSNSEVVFDSMGRLLKYSFTLHCGPDVYSGKVSNIIRDADGITVSYDAVISGKSCSYSR